MSDARPNDHDRPGLSHDRPCGVCGHTAHPIDECDRCTCQHH